MSSLWNFYRKMHVLPSLESWEDHVLLERECNFLKEHFIHYQFACLPTIMNGCVLCLTYFDDISTWYADLFLFHDRLRVVPLFETVKDLRGAGSVIRKLLSIDWYREHIEKNHTGHQEVCILNFNQIHLWRLRQLYLNSLENINMCAGDGRIF